MLQSTLKQDCCCEWLNVQTFSVWDAGRSLQQVGGTMKRAARNNEQTVHATACANKNGVTRLQLLSWLYEYAGTTYVWPFRTTVSPQLAAKLPRPRGQMLVNKAWRCYLWRVRQSTSFDLLKRNRKGKKITDNCRLLLQPWQHTITGAPAQPFLLPNSQSSWRSCNWVR